MTNERRRNQRGSALLIVFVFAAIVAITLYTEMPIVVFEAKRAKEQLLIDRASEYTQAVKRYYHKLNQYPPNLDALENTNRVRFLRKRYKDPFTDKADWRLLHAGPNGMLLDSKLKPAANVTGAGNSALGTFNGGQTGGNNTNSPFGGGGSTFGNNSTFGSNGNNANSGFGGNSGFGSSGNNATSGFGGNSGFGSNGNNANSGFGGNSGFGSSGNNANTGFGGNNGSSGNNSFGGNTGSGSNNGQSQPFQSFNQQSAAAAPPPAGGNPALFPNGIASNAQGIDPNVLPAQRSPAITINPPGQGAIAGSNGINPATAGGYSFANGQIIGPNGQPVTPPQNNTDPQNPNAAVGGLIANPNPYLPQTAGPSAPVGSAAGRSGAFNSANGPSSAFGNSFGSSSSSSSNSAFGNTQGGNLAGVASKAENHGIKVVNDQQQYSLWEFYYDPTKDASRNLAGALNQTGAAAGVQNGQNSPFGSNSNGQSSPFGGTGNTGNGFGNNQSPGNSSGFGNFGSGLSGMNNSNSQNGFGSRNQGNPTSTQPNQTTQAPPPQ